MNRDEMEARVFSKLRDENKSFVTSDDVVDWLQEADLDLAARQRDLEGELPGTVGADGDVDLPADFLEAKWLRLGADDDVDFVGDQVFHSWKYAADTPNNTLGRVFGSIIELYPVPGSAIAFVLHYYRTPTVMSAGSSTSEHAEHLHRKLVYYARAEGLWKMGRDAEGDKEFARYEDGLQPANTGREKNFVGPLSLIPGSGPFDDADYDRHDV